MDYKQYAITLERNEQISAKWMIKREELKNSKDREDGYYKLDCTTFESKLYPDLQYRPRLILTDRGSVYIYIWLMSTNVKCIKHNFLIQVKSAQTTASLMCHSDNVTIFHLCNLHQFNKKDFFINNVLNIDIRVMVKKAVLFLPEIDLKPLNMKKEKKDFVIDVKGIEIKVHKKVLCEYSSVFTVMLESNWKESIENKLEILDFSVETVQTAINLLYNGFFSVNYDIQNAIQLLYFADKYDINQLKMYAENCFIPKLSMLNVYEFTNLSVITNSPELRKHCTAMLRYCKTDDPGFPINSKQLYPEILTEISEKSFVTVCKSI